MVSDRKPAHKSTSSVKSNQPELLELAKAQEWAQSVIDKLFCRTCDWDNKPTVTLRYYRGIFYEWIDGRYWPLADADIQARVANYMREPRAYLSKHDLDRVYLKSAENVTRNLVDNVLFNIRTSPRIYIPSHYDAPCWAADPPDDSYPTGPMLCMENGLLDLNGLVGNKDATEDDVLHSWTPRYFNLVRLPYRFDLSAKHERWCQFQCQIFADDTGKAELLRQWCGYLLSGDTNQHKFLLAVGEGANGKSVLFRVIEGLLGEENVSHVPLEAFGDRFALSPTIGKLANIVSEVGHMDKVAEGRLKEFVGADLMQIDRKYMEPLSVKPTAHLMLATNNLPHFADRSAGLWRRVIVMPFNQTFSPTEQDHHLAEKLLQELPGIFNWAIDGLRSLNALGGFLTCDSCDAALAQYRIDCDSAREFLLEFYQQSGREISGALLVQANELYTEYKEWSEKSGFKPVAANNFGKTVHRVFPDARKRRLGGSSQRYHVYDGIERI